MFFTWYEARVRTYIIFDFHGIWTEWWLRHILYVLLVFPCALICIDVFLQLFFMSSHVFIHVVANVQKLRIIDAIKRFEGFSCKINSIYGIVLLPTVFAQADYLCAYTRSFVCTRCCTCSYTWLRASTRGTACVKKWQRLTAHRQLIG